MLAAEPDPRDRSAATPVDAAPLSREETTRLLNKARARYQAALEATGPVWTPPVAAADPA